VYSRSVSSQTQVAITGWRLANCPCLAASVLWCSVGHLSKRADEVHKLGGDDAHQVLGVDGEIYHGLGVVEEVDHGQGGDGLTLSGTRWRRS